MKNATGLLKAALPVVIGGALLLYGAKFLPTLPVLGAPSR